MAEQTPLHNVSLEDLQTLIQGLIRSEFASISAEVQRVIGDDDLVSSGTACRILGVCRKVFKILESQGHFSVFHHLKERRYLRSELLDYRNKHRVGKVRN